MNENDVSLEFTPNPNTLKFVVSKVLLEKGAVNLLSLDEATKASPLASQLFKIKGVIGVMIGRNFITLTKDDAADWEKLYQEAHKKITVNIQKGEAILNPNYSSSPKAHDEASGEIESKIKKILDEEIRPAVAMDGGDITFDKYDSGTVYLYLQGSCSGCPSSAMTLKMGIETRLKEMIPEVQEVVAT